MSGAVHSGAVRIAVVGPVYPYRGAIANCTGLLADDLRERAELTLVSFKRQYPKRFYPGGSDVDESVRDLAPSDARFSLDILDPRTWMTEGLRLRRERPDAIIIVWWIWVWAIPYLVVLALAGRRAKTVVQCHNIGDKEPRWWKTLLANRIFQRADLLVVHSRLSVEELVERFGEEVRGRTLPLFLPVIPVGRELPDRKSARERLGLEGPVVLFFGLIRPYKGLDLAIRAWKWVREEIRLVVAGEAWFGAEPEMRALADSEGVADRIRFDIRYVPDPEAADFFAAADVVIAPYRYENQSAVAMTAFHAGRPVIATRVGGLPDIIEEGTNGFLVPPEEPRALAQAINRFFSEGDHGKLEGGAAASAQKYSWERYGSRLVEAVRGIL